MRILQPRGDPGLRGGGRSAAMARTPVLPEGANVGPQSTQLSRFRRVSRTAGAGHGPALRLTEASGRFSIAANVKPALIYNHLISPAVLRFDSPVTRGSRFSSRSASGRLMMG